MFIAINEELSQIFIEIVLRCTAVKNRDRYIHRRVKVTVTDTWIYLPGQFYKKNRANSSPHTFFFNRRDTHETRNFWNVNLVEIVWPDRRHIFLSGSGRNQFCAARSIHESLCFESIYGTSIYMRTLGRPRKRYTQQNKFCTSGCSGKFGLDQE